VNNSFTDGALILEKAGNASARFPFHYGEVRGERDGQNTTHKIMAQTITGPPSLDPYLIHMYRHTNYLVLSSPAGLSLLMPLLKSRPPPNGAFCLVSYGPAKRRSDIAVAPNPTLGMRFPTITATSSTRGLRGTRSLERVEPGNPGKTCRVETACLLSR